MSLTILPVRKPREVHRPYAIFAALQVLDVATTGFILTHWPIRSEGNPLVAALFEGAGLSAGLALVLAFKLAVVYLLWTCQTKIRVLSAIYSLVIVNNLLFLFLYFTQGTS